MSISYRDDGELRVIMLAGRMDVGGWESAASQLAGLTQDPMKIVLDLSALPLLASIGIRAIAVSAKDVAARGGKMAVVADAASTVMTTLRLTGLDQVVPIFRRARDAESAVRG